MDISQNLTEIGHSLFTFTLKTAIYQLCTCGTGPFKFSDTKFYIQTDNFLESVSLKDIQNIADYNGDQICLVQHSLVNNIQSLSHVISTNACNFLLKLVLNDLFPFLKNRQTRTKTFIFHLSHAESGIENASTTYLFNSECLIITIYLKNVHSISAFLYLLIHELSHALLDYCEENGGHVDSFYEMGAYLTAILQHSPNVKGVVFHPVSRYATA